MHIRSLPAWIATLGCLLAGGCGDAQPTDPLERIRQRGALIVATEAEFRPFEYVDDKGEIVGFDIDLARAIANDLGVKLELRNAKFESIIPELVSRRADLILSGMTVTEERSRSVDFSQPYFYSVTALLVAKGKAAEVRSVADLNQDGRVVAVKEATTGEQTALSLCPKARIVSHKTENGAALDVVEGRADAFLYDLSSVKEHHRQHPDKTVLVPDPITFEPYAVAVHKDDRTLLARVNEVLAALRKHGRLAELVRRHAPDGSLEPR